MLTVLLHQTQFDHIDLEETGDEKRALGGGQYPLSPPPGFGLFVVCRAAMTSVIENGAEGGYR